MNDDLGDRMKVYEMAEAGRKFMPLLPIVARLDGKGFSSFTKGLLRPYDERLSNLMVDCTKYLVSETNACCGYTQSDEITLAWYAPDYKSEIYFAGRISKMVSVLAAMVSVYFNANKHVLPETHVKKTALFDCRCWNVPNIIEGTNSFLWREQDATKNSVSMAARSKFSHKQINNKNSKEMMDMLMSVGINWNDYPNFFKRGTYVQRKVISRAFSTEELDKLPLKHAARTNKDLIVERTEYVTLDLPPLGKIKNRDKVIFFGEEPELFSEEENA